MSESGFDPRVEALNHAARAETQEAKAIACGLVYIGDQLAAINTEGGLTDSLNAIVNLLEQLDVTINNRLVDLAKEVADA